MSEPIDIRDAIEMHPEVFLAGYGAGMQIGKVRLDRAWAAINEMFIPEEDGSSFDRGHWVAIEGALVVIESLGGMDPAERAKK